VRAPVLPFGAWVDPSGRGRAVHPVQDHGHAVRPLRIGCVERVHQEAAVSGVWPAPVYLAMVHDYRTKPLIQPAYVIGVLAVLTMRLVLPLNTSPTWHALAAHITKLYQPSAAAPR
jgi:hypothetical protein